MGRKALFFDVDGTLLSDITRTVPESAVRALLETRKKGNLVFINSGRVYAHLGVIRKLVDVDGYLCGCGTFVLAEGKVLYYHEVPEARGEEIKDIIRRCGFDGVLEGADGCCFQQGTSRFPRVEQIKKSIAGAGSLTSYGWDEKGHKFDKFCVVADENSDKEGFVKAIAADFQVIDRGDEFYECVPVGHSKATAIEVVRQHYGLSMGDIYVFGDSSNDLAMFEYADNAVLMGKHDKVLEPYASFVTRTVEEDGVAYAMQELGLL